MTADPPDWSVRDEQAATQTGFGSEGALATSTYQALIDKARASGTGGEFSLLKNGVVVSRAFVPKGGGEG